MVVHSEFSVRLWSKALNLDLRPGPSTSKCNVSNFKAEFFLSNLTTFNLRLSLIMIMLANVKGWDKKA